MAEKAETADAPFDVTVRGRLEIRSAGETFTNADPLAAFDSALACTDRDKFSEPVIEWVGTDRLAALDVDFHGVPTPDSCAVRRIMLSVNPKPRLWWVTHGGGLRLIYLATPTTTAHDQAAIARYILPRLLLAEGVRASGAPEIKKTTRHPGYLRLDPTHGEQHCGVADRYNYTGDSIKRSRAILLGEDTGEDIDPERVNEWLEGKGWVRGGKYPHDCCLIRPTDTGERDPVRVLDGGIFCHVCASKEPSGFRPWKAIPEITGERTRAPNVLRCMVKARTHWAHARHVIDDKDAYLALLRLWHVEYQENETRRGLEEGLVNLVFFPEIKIVRGRYDWLDCQTLAPASSRGLEKIIESMPACRYVREDGKTPASMSKVGTFQGDFDLTSEGYPAVIPLRGVDMAERVRPADDTRIFACTAATPPFVYRPECERNMAEVEETISACYPGVNLNLLRLLIACKGLVQQGNITDVPQIAIEGQTQAGKSVTARLAAEIACDMVKELRPPSQDRLLQMYAVASDSCSYALFNEFSKSGISGMQLRDYCLMFTKGIVYHKLYSGPRAIDNPAVVVMTDPVMPDEIRDPQTARRIALINLGGGGNDEGKDWQLTCGTGKVECWRSGLNGYYAPVADAFLSDVIDRFFKDRVWTFKEVVHELGFLLLSEQDRGDQEEFKRFYDLVIARPAEPFCRRVGQPGWRVVKLQDNSDLTCLYRELTTEGTDLQRLKGAKWGTITGRRGMNFDAVPHRQQVGVCFDVGGVPVVAA